MPDIERLYKEYGSDGQVEIVLVNCGENTKTVQAFLNQNKYTMPVAYDSSGKISDAYDVNAIPRTIIFGKDGAVVKDYMGSQSYGTFKSAIENALKG